MRRISFRTFAAIAVMFLSLAGATSAFADAELKLVKIASRLSSVAADLGSTGTRMGEFVTAITDSTADNYYNQLWLAVQDEATVDDVTYTTYKFYNVATGRAITSVGASTSTFSATEEPALFYAKNAISSTASNTSVFLNTTTNFGNTTTSMNLQVSTSPVGYLVGWYSNDGSNPNSRMTITEVTTSSLGGALEVFNAARGTGVVAGKTYRILSMYSRYLSAASSAGSIYSVADATTDGTQYFRFVDMEDGTYAIQNILSQNYIQHAGSNNAYAPGMVRYRFVVEPMRTDSLSPFYTNFKFTQNGTSRGLHDASSRSHLIVSWNNTAAANVYTLESVSLTDDEITALQDGYALSSFSTGKAYKLLSYNDYIMTGGAEGTAMTATTTTVTTGSQYFRFVDAGNGTYTIQNAAAKQYIDAKTTNSTQYAMQSDATSAFTIAKAELGDSVAPYFTFLQNDNTGYYLNHSNGRIVSWNQADYNSRFRIVDAGLTDEEYETFFGEDAYSGEAFSIDASKAYRLISGRSRYVYASASGAAMTTTSSATTDGTEFFQFEAQTDGSYAIRNVLTHQYISHLSTASWGYYCTSTTPAGFTPSILYTDVANELTYYVFTQADGTSNGFTLHEDGSSNLVAWYATENGSYATYSGFRIEDSGLTSAEIETLYNNYVISNTADTYDASKVYRLISDSYSLYATANGTGSHITTSSELLTDGSQYFRIVAASDSTVKIRTFYDYTYINNGSIGSFYSIATSAQTFIMTNVGTEASPKYTFREADADYGLHCSSSQSYKLVGWYTDVTGGNNAASVWRLQDVGLTADEITDIEDHFASTTITTGQVYRIASNAYNRYATVDDTAYTLATSSSESATGSQYFTFETSGSGYLIKNVLTDRYVGSVSRLSARYSTDTEGTVFTAANTDITSDYTTWTFTQSGKQYGLHCGANQSYNIVAWNTSGTDWTASVWRLEKVDITSAQIDSLKAVLAEVTAATELTTSDLSTFFSDDLCTTLTSTYASMSESDFASAIASLPSSAQTWMKKIHQDAWTTYEKDFRVEEAEVMSEPWYWANKLNTTCYSPMYNPTGITLAENELAYIFVGADIPDGTTLYVQAHTGYVDVYGSYSQQLSKGLNVFRGTTDGSQLYIDYVASNGALLSQFANIPYHIEGGTVNGFFDARTRTDADWTAMKAAGLFQDNILDIVGERTQWRALTSSIIDIQYPVEDIAQWDRALEIQHDLMGINACPDSLKSIGGEDVYEDYYPKYFNNRMLGVCWNGGSNPYSTTYYVYMSGTGNNMSDGILTDPDVWVIGHEVGHHNQGAINMAGCTEVSNNVFSNAVAYKFGFTARTESMTKRQSLAESGLAGLSWATSTVFQTFHATNLYYQLYLYYHMLGHNELFYQKLFKKLRSTPLHNRNNGYSSANAADEYLNFAVMASECAGEDLSEFFDFWGFFYNYGTYTVTDYVSTTLTIDADQITSAKASMAACGEKANSALMFIDDFYDYNNGQKKAIDSWRAGLKSGYEYGDYHDFVSTDLTEPTGFVATYDASTGAFSVPETAEGAAGIKVYSTNGNLIYFGNTHSFTIPSALLDSVGSFVVSLPDGTDMPLYLDSEEGTSCVKITVYNATNTEGTTRWTNGEDTALPSDERDGANAISTFAYDGSAAALKLLEEKNVVATDYSDTYPAFAKRFVVTDKADIVLPIEFYAEGAEYERTNTSGFNSYCLPYRVECSSFGTNAVVEDVQSITTNSDGSFTVTFQEIDEDYVEAGRPVFVYCPAEDAADWNLSQLGVNVTTDATASVESLRLVGSFTKQTIGAGKYKLNAAGDALGVTTAKGTVTPFRAYLEAVAAGGAAHLKAVHTNREGTVTAITDLIVGEDGSLQLDAPLYDLQGRRVAVPAKGNVYIQNGRKIIYQ